MGKFGRFEEIWSEHGKSEKNKNNKPSNIFMSLNVTRNLFMAPK